MRLVLILLLMLLSVSGYSQSTKNDFETTKYGGTFQYELGKSGAYGRILIYPDSDTTVLFYIDIGKGAPSYNMGFLYDRVRITNDRAIYESGTHDCRWTFLFAENKIIVKTLGQSHDCGFGGGIFADGIFERTSKVISMYFVNGEGEKIFFKTTPPEKYNGR
jgi:hypothetical protein